jgi:hypothetical protein
MAAGASPCFFKERIVDYKTNVRLGKWYESKGGGMFVIRDISKCFAFGCDGSDLQHAVWEVDTGRCVWPKSKSRSLDLVLEETVTGWAFPHEFNSNYAYLPKDAIPVNIRLRGGKVSSVELSEDCCPCQQETKSGKSTSS